MERATDLLTEIIHLVDDISDDPSPSWHQINQKLRSLRFSISELRPPKPCVTSVEAFGGYMAPEFTRITLNSGSVIEIDGTHVTFYTSTDDADNHPPYATVILIEEDHDS